MENYAAQMPDVAPRAPEVESEVNNLVAVSEELEKQLAGLEARLGSVLAQRKEVGEASQSQPEPVRVPLASALHTRFTHLETLRNRVRSMTSRLEL